MISLTPAESSGTASGTGLETIICRAIVTAARHGRPVWARARDREIAPRRRLPTTEAHNSGLYSIGKIICKDFSEPARADSDRCRHAGRNNHDAFGRRSCNYVTRPAGPGRLGRQGARHSAGGRPCAARPGGLSRPQPPRPQQQGALRPAAPSHHWHSTDTFARYSPAADYHVTVTVRHKFKTEYAAAAAASGIIRVIASRAAASNFFKLFLFFESEDSMNLGSSCVKG
jgi:hypothetical protein